MESSFEAIIIITDRDLAVVEAYNSVDKLVMYMDTLTKNNLMGHAVV